MAEPELDAGVVAGMMPSEEAMRARADAMKGKAHKKVEEAKTADKPVPIKDAAEVKKQKETPSNLVQLDPALFTEIELVSTRKKLAETQVELLKMRLVQALRDVEANTVEEGVLLAKVQAQVGRRGNITLIDPAKGLVKVG